MLRRRLRHCKASRLGLLLLIALTAATLTVVKNHNKTAYFTNRNLEIAEENHNSNVNCTKILRGDIEAIQNAKLELLTVKYRREQHRLTENDYINMTKDCYSFTRDRKYILYPLSDEEREFSIAYSIVVHHKIDMLERLLRTIYMPQNYYCIHVDKKSSESFMAAVKGISSCFENVFIASESENVVYASWRRVQADLNCMKDLHHAGAQWKYLINLCGMDFPIKTNREMVQMLKALKGENSLETEKMPPHKEVRWRKHYEITDNGIRKTDVDKMPPPFEIPVFSGSAYFVFSRAFVSNVLEDDKIRTILEWSKDTYSPDEFLWATLQRFPGMPGSVPANSKYDVSDMNSIARFVKWEYLEGDVAKGAPYPPCSGTHVRSVCVFGGGDLQFMLGKHHLFANKFDMDVDPTAIQCLEEYLRHKALYPQIQD
ncbi:beta-1,3-galactosyl-O-glycosyl-glycoprotein beta-1,6-N-acetylglucosaminyltransferase [Hyla sarda]|uniref:beta-1,3-galactosyl-O-glycosyl-glycoprotein beta-1,6-N-acetylglucosaminyltransferase n=1 Tax=Hyla sarda TaxID=327740 RepID=UPI0024C22E84|nr:beta-1,3-galactosyl-O-glycosyl-glycoprotein beta-1,6-N-acetylglucosaminyltransferase [Hyla sarda]XP_056379369.1 beta-1,3-galactosyl-O-glycosyl-glycoprotein beta-1,6-N-acetylglucosaminyltransferase [Hyla sarda]XP_056379379.1 beta-1,3-galactosyl-O-glycosyl-glycoprotein beta-1,6-N-acetylglucosaminyltransferase [Hyla sarda]XP_056379385.1 beta-1,3-galactosyl-O-glycosyl-glycoprotein beta-1,6-N-acetylglucosaminyltransferase [Hyla sarda]